MSNTKSFLSAAALASVMAVPAFAIEVPVDAVIGLAPEDMTTVVIVQDSAFVGNEVRTSDQIVVGLVEGVYQGPDGSMMVIVTLNSDVGAKSSVKTFTLPLPADTTADGSLTLGWTESELFTALSGNLERSGTGSSSADDNESDDGSSGDNEGTDGDGTDATEGDGSGDGATDDGTATD